MRYHPDLLNELNLLLHFDLDTTRQGIKVHHDAEPSLIAAAIRLHEKGLSTQPDGGYLTDLGREASEHAQALLTLLREPATA
ncbi:TIGR02647 family protein [Oceanisphaera arctica]|uniref:TIGR02647 family protein n=1 Tax=Oceanisphaera arctica TaxID=641510 RepID=A0A2P5TPS7_9GAMM|nr:TIGR02647 family protein [Oceanisphaera arctica]PPL17688.1 TIGR02647 family protein [Oceanisphaera arctica]GHA18693.1 DNA-binding protein [Oceanisphaera arctica]